MNFSTSFFPFWLSSYWCSSWISSYCVLDVKVEYPLIHFRGVSFDRTKLPRAQSSIVTRLPAVTILLYQVRLRKQSHEWENIKIQCQYDYQRGFHGTGSWLPFLTIKLTERFERKMCILLQLTWVWSKNMSNQWEDFFYLNKMYRVT